MVTNNFYEDLKEYFKNTSREQIELDWAKSEKFDNIVEPFGLFLDHSILPIDLSDDKILIGYKEFEHISPGMIYVPTEDFNLAYNKLCDK